MKKKLVLFIALVLALVQGATAQGIDINGFIAGEETSLRGDVNGDGQVGIADVTDLIDYILGSPSEDFIVENADVDGDGNVAISDISDIIDTIITAATQPTITVSPTALDFGYVPVGQSKIATITVTGTNLTGSIDLTWVESIGGEFTVTPSTLPATGGTVRVTYTPEGAHSSGAQLKFSSGGASARVIATGRGVKPTITAPDTVYIVSPSKTATFTVRGTFLTGDITLTTNNSFFMISPVTLPASGGTVTVTYAPTTAGNSVGYITITARSGAVILKRNIVVIYLQQSRLTVTPTSYDFGTVELGNTVTKSFSVVGTNTTGTLRLASAESVGGQFTVSPTTLPANGGTVTVTFNPNEVGSHAGLFTVSSTADGVSAKATYTGKCIAAPTLTITPISLDFGTVALGGSKSQSFRVMGTNLTENVTLTYSGSPYFSFSPTTITKSNATNGATVTVTYQPTAVGSHTGTITITCGSLTKTVTITGTCVAPTLTVNPTSLSFGSIPIGSSKQMRFTVTGTNLTGNLNLSSSSSNIYSVSPSTISPDANGTVSKQVTVTFSPTLVKTYTGTVTVSGGGATSKTVSLTGKGIEETVY